MATKRSGSRSRGKNPFLDLKSRDNLGKDKKTRNFTFLYFIIAIVVILIINGYLSSPEVRSISYKTQGNHRVTYEKVRKPMFLDISPDSVGKDYSEETACGIDNEIRRMVADAHKSVMQTLSDKKALLEQGARILLEKEVIEGEELRRLVAEYHQKEGIERDDEPQYGKEPDRSYQ
jgi:hypothetical protein